MVHPSEPIARPARSREAGSGKGPRVGSGQNADDAVDSPTVDELNWTASFERGHRSMYPLERDGFRWERLLKESFEIP